MERKKNPQIFNITSCIFTLISHTLKKSQFQHKKSPQRRKKLCLGSLFNIRRRRNARVWHHQTPRHPQISISMAGGRRKTEHKNSLVEVVTLVSCQVVGLRPIFCLTPLSSGSAGRIWHIFPIALLCWTDPPRPAPPQPSPAPPRPEGNEMVWCAEA